MTIHSLLRICARVAMTGLVAVFMTGCDELTGYTADQYYTRAEAQLEKGDYRAAIIELKNALQKDGQHAAARLRLGQIYLDLGDAPAAEIELGRARDSGADSGRTTLALSRAWLLQGKFDRIFNEVSPDEFSTPADKAAALTLLGRARLARTHLDLAAQAFNNAIGVDTNAAGAYVGLGQIALLRRDRATAGTEFERATAANPRDPEVLAFGGDLAFLDRKFTESESAFLELAKLRKGTLDAMTGHLGAARAEIAAGKIKEAIDNVNVILRLAPRHANANYLRSLAAYQAKDFQNAKNFSEQVLAVADSHVPSLLIAGAANYALGHNETALRQLRRYVVSVPTDIAARRLLAAAQLKGGSPGEAVKTLAPAVARGEDARLLQLIGVAQARSGDLPAAQQSFERAVAVRPDDAALRTQLGTTKIALGEMEEGLDDLEEAVEKDPESLRAQYTLIAAYLRAKKFDDALAAAKALQERQPQNANGYTLAGMAHAGKEQFDEARAAFLKALDVNPADRNANRNLAALAERDRDFALAQKYLRTLLEKEPNDALALMAMARLDARLGHPQEAMARLEKAVQENPTMLQPRLTLSRVHLLARQPAKALETIEPALATASNQAAVLEVAGRAQLALGRFDEARRTFGDLVRLRPEAPRAHEYLASALEGAGDTPGALAEANKALEIEPTNPTALFQQARLLARTGAVDRASAILTELAAQYPSDPGVAELEGVLALATRRPNDAVTAFKRALTLRDNNFNAVALGHAQMASGDFKSGEATMKGWLEKYPNDIYTRMSLAEAYLQSAALVKARDQYAKVVEQTPNNVMALNNLAWVLTELGDTSSALPRARRAAELAPESGNILDTLGYTLLKKGSKDEAVEVLRRAYAKAPANAAIQVRLAEALSATGVREEARDILKTVLGGNPQGKTRADAERLLRELGG